MDLQQYFKSALAVTAVVAILAAGSPALVAENMSSPAPAASARITALNGKLFDMTGKPLSVGSELRTGDIVKTLPGESARLVLSKAGTSSSIICIESDSEVVFTKISPSGDPDYPLLDTVISLRNHRVRNGAKQIF